MTKAKDVLAPEWTAAIPRHWKWERNKDLLFEAQDLSADGSEELLSVSHLTGVGPRSEKNVTMTEAESLEGYRVVEEGDLVINTMWAWMGALGISPSAGIVSPAYGVYRARPSAAYEPRFFDYMYRSTEYVMEMTRVSRGIWSSRLRIYPEVFLRMAVPVPSVAEQRALADYLDHATARIDTLIEEQQRLIEMLRERRLGVVRAGVTGLLSGGRRGTSDTWFGTLPEEWTSARIRYDFTVILGKMINASKVPLEDTVDAPYLAAGSIQPEALVLDDSKRMVFTRAELTTLDLREGDVVVVEGGAGYGRSHYLRRDLIGWGFQNHVARLRPSTGRVDGLFATYCLKACLASGYIEANNRTATLPSLSRDVLGSIQIPVPPLAEQQRVTRYLDEQTARIDALIAETERFIELSRERRAALITAAVTGQIDLRKAE